ncbi:MAG: HepT-like ribonuclease domain-containing protein [Blastocatellia bacterium]
MRDDRERLLDIQEAIERIERYAAQGRETFDQDELIQTWTLHHLQILCEAARAISAEFKQQHPEIAWPQIAGMRNILVHHYFGIDLNVVWAVVERELPTLKQQTASLLGD